mmetsp:Transcript_51508/g.122484  ORF Transcript_51508/g.122484 Transcript_51508/m.122484 type:complete len:432 (-) Transcript_51508:55-1350(-)
MFDRSGMRLLAVASLFLAHADFATGTAVLQTGSEAPATAPLGGVYCRGAACMFRKKPPAVGLEVEPPTGQWRSSEEFCRGLACAEGLGFPQNPRRDSFKVKCIQLLAADETAAQGAMNTVDVRRRFLSVCPRRVGSSEAKLCTAYADVVTASVASMVDAPSVGTMSEVCLMAYHFIDAADQAVHDLQLTEPAYAQPVGRVLLSSARTRRLGQGAAASTKPRGPVQHLRSWKEIGQRYVGGLLPLPGSGKRHDAAHAEVGADDSCSQESRQIVFAQVGQSPHLIPINGSSQAGCVNLPPLPVSAGLYQKCEQLFGEIMLGKAQTALTTVSLTKAWCGWQASAETWTGEFAGAGHAEWDHRTCDRMEMLMAFALREHLDSRDGLDASKVCNNFFLGAATVNRVDMLMKTADAPSARGSPTDGMAVAHVALGAS